MGAPLVSPDFTAYRRMCARARAYGMAAARRESLLRRSSAFKVVRMVRTAMDDWFLDPLIGLFFPGAGDLVASLATVPALYLATVKIRSARLVMAIVFTMLVDWLSGLIPGVGDVVDAFYRSHSISYRLCQGYVANDSRTRREVDRRAAGLVVTVVALGLVLWLAFDAICSMWQWLQGLFG